jgi:hypothetical protein
VADFREQLAKAVGQEHKLLFYGKGRRHPPYSTLAVPDSLAKFTQDVAPASPFTDPRGKRISIVKNNFPKLSGLEHLTLSKKQFSASDIVKAIEDGTINLVDYDPTRDDRSRTLFWVPEVLQDPDAIYSNRHKIVVGNEVYVCVYDKMGSTIKLVFTLDIKGPKGTIIRTVPTTSFLTDPVTAISYVHGEPLYRRK